VLGWTGKLSLLGALLALTIPAGSVHSEEARKAHVLGQWSTLDGVGSRAGSGFRNQAAAPPTRTMAARNTLEAQVLTEINGLRARRKLKPLHFSWRLNAAAGAHSRAMARRGFFSHESSDGTAFWKRVRRYYPQGRYQTWSVGENLLWASPSVSAASALRMWMDSPPHRANLLTSRWREIGLSAVHINAAPGVYGGREVTIVTADFGIRR
jgi:uncharacterized protein YkwD